MQVKEKTDSSHWTIYLNELVSNHTVSSHPIFHKLQTSKLTTKHIASFLRNYDAHASALRRLLLKAITIMPEDACGYILENVRNEYGNGNPLNRHQLQILDLARQAGVNNTDFKQASIKQNVRTYIKQITPLFYPLKLNTPKPYYRPAISAGAITTIEILAQKEFIAMQQAFIKLNLGNHIWFNHVTLEAEHADESLDLALYFIKHKNANEEIEFGINSALNVTCHLYDGLLEAIG